MKFPILEKINLKVLSICVATLCFGSVGVALITQHMFNMQPCAWCILQRMIFILIGFIALGSLMVNKRNLTLLYWIGIESVSTLGIIIAAYHFEVASKSFECGISIAEKIISFTKLNELIPSVFGIMGLCGDSSYILGIPYVLISLGMFFFISLFSYIALVKMKKSI